MRAYSDRLPGLIPRLSVSVGLGQGLKVSVCTSSQELLLGQDRALRITALKDRLSPHPNVATVPQMKSWLVQSGPWLAQDDQVWGKLAARM